MDQESTHQLQIVFVDLLHSDELPILDDALAEVVNDPAFRLGFSVCVDCRHLPGIPTHDELAVMARQTGELAIARLSRRIAIVAETRDARAAGERFIGLLTGGLGDRTKVVANEDEALDWFGS